MKKTYMNIVILLMKENRKNFKKSIDKRQNNIYN